MSAKFIVLVAFLALANAGMVRRDAPAANPLEELVKHANEDTFTDQLNQQLNTQEVNKVLNTNTDAVLHQMSSLSNSRQSVVGGANGNIKEAESTRQNIAKSELRKAHSEVEQEAATK